MSVCTGNPGCPFSRYGPTPQPYANVLEALDSLYDSECQDHSPRLRNAAAEVLRARVEVLIMRTHVDGGESRR